MALSASLAAPDVRSTLLASIERHRATIEARLDEALPPEGAPPTRLHAAMRHAALNGGKRVRPLLTLLVAEQAASLDETARDLVERTAAAVELIHCASLVHDDLPAFDDAATRRGRPSCHVAYGEPTAILAGDALLTLAFEVVAGAREGASRALKVSRMLAEATGARRGIIGGQAFELDPVHTIDVPSYHARKTAALFRAAAAGGAVAAGLEGEMARWGRFGELVGMALQLRDDIDDCTGDEVSLGKPAGADARNGRPNAALRGGLGDARKRLASTLREAAALVGEPCERTAALHAVLALVGGRLGRLTARGRRRRARRTGALRWAPALRRPRCQTPPASTPPRATACGPSRCTTFA